MISMDINFHTIHIDDQFQWDETRIHALLNFSENSQTTKQCELWLGLGLGLVRMPQKATCKTRYIIITIALAALADSAEPKLL